MVINEAEIVLIGGAGDTCRHRLQRSPTHLKTVVPVSALASASYMGSKLADQIEAFHGRCHACCGIRKIDLGFQRSSFGGTFASGRGVNAHGDENRKVQYRGHVHQTAQLL